MARQTIQVRNFYEVAKSIGLRRGDFTARSPKDSRGEYQALRVTIWKRLTEEQVRKLAESYQVNVYILKGITRWDIPLICEGRPGLFIVDLDNKDEYGIHPRKKG